MADSFEERLKERERRIVGDARRFAERDADLCQLCGARGADKRSLVLDCGYAVDEVLPEAINLHAVEPPMQGRGFYLCLCKACRGRLLSKLVKWRDECLALRGLPMDHDGNLKRTGARRVPVRVMGAIHWLTDEEWQARYGR